MLYDKVTEVTAQYHEYHALTRNTMLYDKVTEVTAQYHEYHALTRNTMLYDKVTEVTAQYHEYHARWCFELCPKKQCDHPKWSRIELGGQKTLEFPFWAKSVVVKKGSWLKTPGAKAEAPEFQVPRTIPGASSTLIIRNSCSAQSPFLQKCGNGISLQKKQSHHVPAKMRERIQPPK
ncbi:hypothetical protein DFH08DRAFT_825913 [Mycena albidolilacea]|uniref:Uncharacterized protein n=1 Tax=Mycena albidolilacea TaxID=1033008 RepID=A0AAD6Z1U1_9AGAR|nr:hypothetical protein DFH08DRAFT_825913 [Mycena albidolilacea]